MSRQQTWAIMWIGLLLIASSKTVLGAEYKIITDGKLTGHAGIVGRSTRAGDGKDDRAFILNGLYKFVYAGAGFRSPNARIHARLSMNKLGNTGAGLYVNGHWLTFDRDPGNRIGIDLQFAEEKTKIFTEAEGRIEPGVPFDVDIVIKDRVLICAINGERIGQVEDFPTAMETVPSPDVAPVHKLGVITAIRSWRADLKIYEFAVQSDGPIVPLPETQTIYKSRSAKTNTYRIPALIVSKKGTILAFAEARRNGGGDTADIDTVVRRSEDGGKTWGDEIIVFDERDNVAGNPCPVVDQSTGRIWSLQTWNSHKVHESHTQPGFGEDSRRVFVTYSDDDGRTWAQAKEITTSAKRKHWSWYATGPGAGIQLERGKHKGRLIIPCDHKSLPEGGPQTYHSHILYSDDHGETWHIGAETGHGLNECEAVELENGDLMLNSRNHGVDEFYRGVSISQDGGETFSSFYRDPVLLEPRCQASIRRYRWAEGDKPGIILFSNPARKWRDFLMLRMSYDDAKTWPDARIIFPYTTAYSDIAVLPDGRIGVLFERDNYLKIDLAILPPLTPAPTRAATVEQTDPTIALENDQLKCSLDSTGIREIHDKRIDRTVGLSRDQFSLVVNGHTLESSSIRPVVKRENDSRVAYLYRFGGYTVKVIYELQAGWRFVSKQLFLTGPGDQELYVEKINAFDGQLTQTIAEPVRLTGDRYGVSLRLADAPGNESAAWGCFMLVQNPHTRTETTESSVTLTYEPKMKWAPAHGPFRSDRMCIGTFQLTGNTFRSDMAPEWRYVQDPDEFLAEGDRIDWAEIEAVTDCARAFLLEDRTESVRVHIGWCENDYQIDFATDEGKVEYRRIIDQAAAMGCQYVLYTPSHSTLAPLEESRDAWRWESNLMLNLGQKFRKGQWVPGKDPLPRDIEEILAYAESKDIKLLAYAYPSLPYMQNPEWTAWLTKQGKTPANYLTVDTGLRSFQDWYVDNLVAFCEATGCAGYSFDHWWTAYKADLGDVSSLYQQWYGCRRILETLRQRMPDVIMDGRQQYHHFGTWTWLSGTYPHPMMSDEQPGSFNSIVDLSTDRVNGARQRFIAWRLRTRDFCPIEILPGFITHQTQRSDADRVMRRDHYRVRDWDTLGWKYNLLSSVATAPFNHVVNYIPARDSDEFKSFSKEDQAFFWQWLDFTDRHMDVMRHVRPIIGQPMIGRCDGTAAIKEDRGFVFLFNPNYRKMNARFKLDASIGLERGTSFLIRQLYPVEGLNVGKPRRGIWRIGDDVSLPMDGTSACVLKIEPVESPDRAPMLFNAPGKAILAGGNLTLSGVSGPVGEEKDLIVRLGQETRVKTVTLGGREVSFKQQGGLVHLSVTFAGKPFSQSQQIDDYDPNFTGRVVEGRFAIPKRIFDQLRRRKAEWPVPYTEDDRVAPWVDNSRLLLFAQIAEPYADREVLAKRGSDEVKTTRRLPYGKDDIVIEINGKPVELCEGYNGVYPYVTRTCMGMYADISSLDPDTQYHVKVTLPEGLRPGQFQGLFFEHVENEYTDRIASR